METEIITILTKAPGPMMSRDIAEQLGEHEVTRNVAKALQSLCTENLIRKFGRYYSMPKSKPSAEQAQKPARLSETVGYIPPVPVVGKEAEKGSQAKPIRQLEDAEQAADEEKSRDKRIRAAIQRLKARVSRPEVVSVSDLDFKLDVLTRLAELDPDIDLILADISDDLRRLQALANG